MRLDIQSSLLQELYDHWYRLNDGALPLDNQVDPLEFPTGLFPYIALIEVHEDPIRFFVKIAGNGMMHYARSDFIDKFLGELPESDALQDLITWYTDISEKREAASSSLPFITVNGEEIPAERLALPYVNQEGRVTKLIVANIIHDDKQKHDLP